MVSANYGYYNPYNPYLQQNAYGNTLVDQSYVQTPVFYGNAQMNAVYEPPVPEKPTKDGKDDGSIGFWGATKNFLKGAVKFVTSPFTDENGKFSLGKTLKTLAIGAAVIGLNMIPGVGQVLTPALLAVGFGAGAVGMAKAGVRIASATTDAEAEAAWQSMGSSTATVAATVVGAKAYAKGAAQAKVDAANSELRTAIANDDVAARVAAGDKLATAQAELARYDGVRGAFRSVGKTYADTGRNIKAGYDAVKAGATNLANMTPAEIKAAAGAKYDTAKTWLTNKYDAGVQSVQNGYNAVRNGNASQSIVDAYNSGLPAGATQATSVSEISLANLAKTVVGIAKSKVGLGTATPTPAGTPAANPGFWASARTQAGNAWNTVKTHPAEVATFAILARQDIKPDFYDMLTPQEQAYYDNLSTEEKEAILDQYYSAI